MVIQRTTLDESLTSELGRFATAGLTCDCCQTVSERARAGRHLREQSQACQTVPKDETSARSPLVRV